MSTKDFRSPVSNKPKRPAQTSQERKPKQAASPKLFGEEVYNFTRTRDVSKRRSPAIVSNTAIDSLLNTNRPLDNYRAKLVQEQMAEKQSKVDSEPTSELE